MAEAARLRMDPDDFGEIVGNLLDNARKHARSVVRVGIETGEGGPRFCIDDDGPGVPPHERERIVRRGERASDDAEGSGLGLSIVMDALDQYELSLTVDVSPLGGCRMSFPAAGMAAGAAPGGASAVRGDSASGWLRRLVPVRSLRRRAARANAPRAP